MKTTTMKRILASVSALAMSAVIAAPAMNSFAAEGDGKIIIKSADRQDVVKAETAATSYKVYQIFTLEKEGAAYKYTVNKEWYKDLRDAYSVIESTSIPTTLPEEYPDENDAAIQALNEEFANWFNELGKDENVSKLRKLADLLEANSAAKTETTPVWTDKTGEGVQAELPQGYYLIIDRNAANGSAQSAPILISTDGDEVKDIILKADKPTIEKKIVEGEKRVDANTAGYGDVVTYELTITVPDTSRYEDYTLYVTDQISKGLTLYDKDGIDGFDTKDVTISWVECGEAAHNHTGAAKTPDAAPTFTVSNYTSATTENGESFRINFTNIKTFGDGEWAGHQIKVQYQAKVNANAEIGTAGNPNSAKLTYSNNPNTDGNGTPSTSTKETPEDKVTTYVTEIEIKKTDGTNPLKGAKFKIEKKGNPNTVLYVKVNDDGTATVSADSNFVDDANTTFVIDNTNAALKLKGLSAGEYVITEIEPPKGYNGLQGSITVTIKCKVGNVYLPDTGEEVEFTGEPSSCTWEYSDDIVEGNDKVSSTKSGSYTLTVINKTGSLFPSTGGIGVTIFYTVGIAMLMGAGVLVIVKRKAAER